LFTPSDNAPHTMSLTHTKPGGKTVCVEKVGAADRTRTYYPIITNFEVHVLDVTGPSRLKPYNPL